MKVYHKRYLSGVLILAMLAFLLSGCKSEDNANNDEINQDLYEKATNVFSVNEFERPKDFYPIDSYYSESRQCFFVFGWYDMDGTAIISYDSNGRIKEIIDLPYMESGFIENAKILYDGNIVITVGAYSKDYEDGLYILSPDGEIIYHSDYVYEYGTDVYITPDDQIYMTSGKSLKIYNNKLEKLMNVESDVTLTNIKVDNSGNIVVYSSYDYKHYMLDIDEKKFVEYTKFIDQQNLYWLPKLYFQENNDIYISDTTGIYKYNTGDEEPEIILDWASSNLIYNNTEIWNVIDEDTVFVSLSDSFTRGYTPAILKRVPESEIKPKINITLANTYDTGTVIDEAIILFNRDNEKYRIVVEDYTKYKPNPGFENPAISQFNKDIITGKIPDLVIIHPSMAEELDTYTSKGFFTDLSEYIDNSQTELLGCVKSTYNDDGKMYHIPIQIELITLAAKTSLVGETPSLTLDQLYSIADNLKEGTSLFSLYPRVFNTAIFSFVDLKNKTCNFESDEFLYFIDFMKNMGGISDPQKGGIKLFSGGYYFSSNEILTSFAEDKVSFLEIPMNKIDSYAIAKLCFGEDDFTLCGFPTKEGNGSELRSNYTLGITEQSVLKEGAAEFLNFLLSDKIQTSEPLRSSGLPVTVRGIEDLIEYSEYYISLSPSSDMDVGETQVTIYKYKTPPYPEGDEYPKLAPYHITLTDADKQKLWTFFNETEIKSLTDETISAIVKEEYSAYENGAVSVEEAAKFIQNRVSTYINEVN